MFTDPIADMLTRIRNAQAVKKKEVNVPLSKLKLRILKLLKKEGYILDFKKDNKKRSIIVQLKYFSDQEKAVIYEIKTISKPGRRVYKGYRELKPIKNGLGTAIISTSRGLMTDKEARKRKLGGEVVCEVF